MDKEIYQSPYRSYRTEKINTEYEQKIQIVIEETDVLITLTKEIGQQEIRDFCTKEIHEIRNIIKFWIKIYPEIQYSLEPILCPENAPEIIKIMCEATGFAHVGPFAGVAGTIAQYLATKIHEFLQKKNLPSDAIVENGGDIYAFSLKDRIIGIIANPKEQCTIGLHLKKRDFPLAICSSSATIGHSLSFGQGDLALIMAKNASLADALATRYGNLLQTKTDINKILVQAQKDSQIKIIDNPFMGTHEQDKNGLTGVFLQIDDNIGAWGNIELTAIE